MKCRFPVLYYYSVSVRPQMVGFGSEQGLSNFETDSEAVTAIAGVAVPALAGIAGYVERA
jgi:hypothetical protein